jgi:hypothetical protein
VQPVTVVLRHSETLNLNFVECSGAVSTEQLGALAACAAQNPALLDADSLNLVRPDADLSGVDLAALYALFAHYQTLYAPLRFQVYRRTAWVCQNPSALPHVTVFAREHDARKAFSTNTRRLETLAEAGEWLLLSAAELDDLERGAGFTEIAVFEDAPPVRHALAR